MAEFDLQPGCNLNPWTCKKCTLQLETPFCPMCGAAAPADKPARKSRTRPNGSGTAFRRGKTWTAQITDGYKLIDKDGITRSQAIHVSKGGFATRRDALAYCETLRKEAAAKRQRQERPQLTVRQIYDAWHEQHETRVGRSTMDCYRAAWRYFEPLYDLPFAEIDLEDLQDSVDSCPRGKRTKENMKALAGLLMKYALPRHQTDMNYAEFIHTGDGEKGTHPAFTAEQVERIRQLIGIVPYADYIYCMIYTGFRPAEFFALTRDSLSGSILYGGAKTAAGKGRAVPLSPKIVQIVKAQAAKDSPFLFPRADGSRMTTNYFRENCFYPVLDAAGIQSLPTAEKPAYYVPYSCRHTFANLLKAVSGADKDKAAMIGHEDYTTTKRLYQSAELEALIAIANQI